MSEVKVKIDLDLDDKLAKSQLENFKKLANQDKITVKVDLDNIKSEAKELKNILSDAFKLDSKALGNLKQMENSLKQINSLIKSQSKLLSNTSSKSSSTEVGVNNKGIESSLKAYLSVSKEIDNVIAKLYKAENKGQTETVDSLRKELSLLEDKKKKLAQLVDANNEYVKQERELARTRAITSMSREDDSNRVKNIREEESQLKSLVSQYEKYEKELTKLKTSQNELRYKGKDGEANALQSQIDDLEKLKQTIKEVNNESLGDKLFPELEKIEQKYREIARVAEETSRGRHDDAQTAKLNKTYQELDKIQSKLEEMQRTRGFLDVDLVEKTNNLLAETRAKLDADGIVANFEDINGAVENLNNNIRDLNSGNTLSRQEANFNTSLKAMETRVESFIDKCKELGNVDHLIERVEQAFRGIDTSNIERGTVHLREFSNTIRQAEREARDLSSSIGGGFFANFGEEFRSNLFTFTAGELLADGIRDAGRALKDFVLEYDSAFTNLKKVANPTDIMDISQLEAIGKKANDIAKNVGQSSQDTINAIADTIQMAGLGMEESIMVAEQTMKLANVAEMTQQAASEGVVTMLSSFNLDPLKEIPIVVDGVTKSTNEMVNSFDVLNHVG